MNLIKFLFLAIYFTGCSLAPVTNFVDKSLYETSTDFENITNTLVADLSTELTKISFDESTPFVITDFVNVNYLDNKSNLGFVLSNELKTSLNRKFKDIEVKEIALGKDIQIGQNGVKILSRKLNELKSEEAKKIKYVLVGTYAITAKKLIVYLKLINYTTGNILASSSKHSYITKEIMTLEESRDKYNYEYIRTPFVL